MATNLEVYLRTLLLALGASQIGIQLKDEGSSLTFVDKQNQLVDVLAANQPKPSNWDGEIPEGDHERMELLHAQLELAGFPVTPYWEGSMEVVFQTPSDIVFGRFWTKKS